MGSAVSLFAALVGLTAAQVEVWRKKVCWADGRSGGGLAQEGLLLTIVQPVFSLPDRISRRTRGTMAETLCVNMMKLFYLKRGSVYQKRDIIYQKRGNLH